MDEGVDAMNGAGVVVGPSAFATEAVGPAPGGTPVVHP